MKVNIMVIFGTVSVVDSATTSVQLDSKSSTVKTTMRNNVAHSDVIWLGYRSRAAWNEKFVMLSTYRERPPRSKHVYFLVSVAVNVPE